MVTDKPKRGRPRKYTDEQLQRIDSYKGKHTPDEASPLLKAEGVDASPRYLRGRWNAPAPVTETVRADGSVEVGIDMLDLDIDVAQILRETLRDNRAIARKAKAEGRTLDYHKATDSTNKTIALLDKITPAPPPNPNDNPLVKLSAEQCIAKLHELRERVNQK